MEKKQKRLIFIVVLVIALAILLNANFNQEDKNSFKYNGFKVYQTEPAVYNIEIYLENDANPHYISIRYDPRELDYIQVEDDLKQRILRNEVYITLTPNLTSNSVIGVAEIAKIIGNKFLFNVPVYTALTYSKENIPVKTCSDVTVETSVIMLKLSNQTRVYRKSDCIVVEGKTEEEIVKASTKLALNLLGITKKN